MAEFVRKQPSGSILIDVGCGNGKYLGINSDIYKVCINKLVISDAHTHMHIHTHTHTHTYICIHTVQPLWSMDQYHMNTDMT